MQLKKPKVIKIIENFGYDQEKVSKFIGKSRSHISNSLRLLTLPNKIIDMIKHEKIRRHC